VAKAVEFIREIMFRFGIPNNIVIDNGTQFTVREFKEFCAHSGIKINYASMSHPQSRSGRTLKCYDPTGLEAQNF
jgi:transposase InsO family protein